MSSAATEHQAVNMQTEATHRTRHSRDTMARSRSNGRFPEQEIMPERDHERGSELAGGNGLAGSNGQGGWNNSGSRVPVDAGQVGGGSDVGFLMRRATRLFIVDVGKRLRGYVVGLLVGSQAVEL